MINSRPYSEPGRCVGNIGVALLVVVATIGFASGGCTTEESECTSDFECPRGESCVQAGGVFVRGGICTQTGGRPADGVDQGLGDVELDSDADDMDGFQRETDTCVEQSTETCNGRDDDCNGEVDESKPCESQQGVCSDVERTCVGGAYESCASAAGPAYQAGDETRFDGKDNDCNGKTDEVVRDVDIASNELTCAILESGALYCWENPERLKEFGISFPYGENFEGVGVAFDFACGRTSSGDVTCWGNDRGNGRLNPPSTRMSEIDVGTKGGCGIETSGTVTCWGQFPDPAGNLSASTLSVEREACAIDTTGRVVCWGEDGGTLETNAPEGTFDDLDVGDQFACALNSSPGRAVCWGGTSSQSAPDSSARDLVEVAVSNDLSMDADLQACGIRQNGKLKCWGAENSLIDAKPGWTFETLDIASTGGLGVRTGGQLAYWDLPQPRAW